MQVSKINKDENKYLFEITLHVKQIQNALSSVAINIDENKDDTNLFEALTYTLSRNNPDGLKSIKNLYNNINKIIILFILPHANNYRMGVKFNIWIFLYHQYCI